ncbi:MAG: HesB/IscA family protein [Rhodoplanes sp.]|jgi:iron-sulfur cluster assembly protein
MNQIVRDDRVGSFAGMRVALPSIDATSGALLMVTLSSEAADAVRNAMSRAGKLDAGLRIIIEAGGCTGPKYSIGLELEPDPEDTVIESSGVRMFIDPGSQRLAAGLCVDFVDRPGRTGFTFTSSAAVASGCACGRSAGASSGGCGMRR